MNSFRLIKFRSFATDPWWAKRVKKLKATDLVWCEAWIAEHDHLGRGDFELAVNRMWLDKPELRESFGNRWKQIDELVFASNVVYPNHLSS